MQKTTYLDRIKDKTKGLTFTALTQSAFQAIAKMSQKELQETKLSMPEVINPDNSFNLQTYILVLKKKVKQCTTTTEQIDTDDYTEKMKLLNLKHKEKQIDAIDNAMEHKEKQIKVLESKIEELKNSMITKEEHEQILSDRMYHLLNFLKSVFVGRFYQFADKTKDELKKLAPSLIKQMMKSYVKEFNEEVILDK